MRAPYLFGAVYIIEQDYTEEEIKRDLRNMKASGFNLTTLWPVANPWLCDHPTGYVFDKTRMVLDLCSELDMRAILQLFGQNQAQEFMPDSLLTPEMMIHDEEGEHVNYNSFWVNLNHPAVRELIKQYFEAAINELKGHPAVYGWDVFNEAHFRSDDPYTVKLYQEWLKEKYHDIQVLNRHWYRRYASFFQITPEKRRSSYSRWSSLLPITDYEEFRSENLTEICRFLYETAKGFDTEHPIIIDGTSSQILYESVVHRNNNEFATAVIPDIYGATFYPKSWGRDYKKTPWMASMYYTMPASAAVKARKPYIVSELQTHTQSALTPGSEVTPEELCHWTWMCIFTGAQAIQLWRWRPFLHGYQSTGRGLTRIDGMPNRRGEAIQQLVGLLERNNDLFTNASVSKPVVKIGVGYKARLYFDAFSDWKTNHWPSSVAGWYRAFWGLGLPVGFTDLDRLDEEDLSTSVLVLPSILALSEKSVFWLERYVKEGGTLIADARLHTINDFGVVPGEGIPGSVLGNVFGVRELDVGSGSGFTLQGEKIPANFMHQILETFEGAQVIGRMEDGTAAVVKNTYGKGMTVYFNSFMGVEMSRAVPAAAAELFIKLLAERIPGIYYAEKSEKVHLSYLDTGNMKLMLAANFSETEEKVRLVNVQAETVIRNIATNEAIVSNNEVILKLSANTASVFTFSCELS